MQEGTHGACGMPVHVKCRETAPRIVEHPSDLAARGDQPATLRCRADGVPTPTVTWYRDGQPVGTSRDDAGSPRMLLPGGSLVFLRLKQGTDEGIYTCVATNRLGTATSRNATVSVAALRENFRLQPGDLVATAGQALELPCVAPWGHPEPSVTWKKDGVALDLTSGRHEVSHGKLRVAPARRSDSGAYVCVATNPAGERESRPALVSVLEKPAIVRPPSDMAAATGSTVELACGTQGDPLPWVQWHKERGDLPWGRHEVDREHTLRLYAVSPADSGTYVCTAQSQLGTAAAMAVLRVEGRRRWHPPGWGPSTGDHLWGSARVGGPTPAGARPCPSRPTSTVLGAAEPRPPRVP
uniref:Ig-like domain-containing protein n=1 Tax=Apteryx owenii TaxID=8824 RepID=A0A8B9QIX2_APTOW